MQFQCFGLSTTVYSGATLSPKVWGGSGSWKHLTSVILSYSNYIPMLCEELFYTPKTFTRDSWWGVLGQLWWGLLYNINNSFGLLCISDSKVLESVRYNLTEISFVRLYGQ